MLSKYRARVPLSSFIDFLANHRMKLGLIDIAVDGFSGYESSRGGAENEPPTPLSSSPIHRPIKEGYAMSVRTRFFASLFCLVAIHFATKVSAQTKTLVSTPETCQKCPVTGKCAAPCREDECCTASDCPAVCLMCKSCNPLTKNAARVNPQAGIPVQGKSFENPGVDFPLVAAIHGGSACEAQRVASSCASSCRDGNNPALCNEPRPCGTSTLCSDDDGLSASRSRLAADLTDYLTRSHMDREHIRQVLQMALDTTAADARRGAMSPEETTEIPFVELDTNLEVRQMRAGFDESQRMLNETRRMLDATQRDVRMMAESLRFLSSHMQRQQASPPARQWESGTSQKQPQFTSDSDLIRQLRQQNADLEDRLDEVRRSAKNATPSPSLVERTLPTSWKSENPLQPMSWQGEKLQPKSHVATPLRPAVPAGPDLVWKKYYVGDVIAPPFANSTFRVMKYIQANVAPESWNAAWIQLDSPGVSLRIRQTPSNHQRISTLLGELRGDDQ